MLEATALTMGAANEEELSTGAAEVMALRARTTAVNKVRVRDIFIMIGMISNGQR